MKQVFTMKELKSMNVKELRKLYRYYYPEKSAKNIGKQQLVSLIHGAANMLQPDKELPSSDEVKIPQSVRVRRIYEQNKQ